MLKCEHGVKLCTLGLNLLVLAACGDGGNEAAYHEAIGETEANTPPTISGKPLSTAVVTGPYSFAPDAHDADGDVVTFRIQGKPVWASFSEATGVLAGTPGIEHIGEYDSIVISVTDGALEAKLEAFGITVQAAATGSAVVSWAAPTQNTDGTPLTDLAGYKLYWGTSPGEYTGSIAIDNPGLTTYVVENLVPATYYFVVTAVNADGAESEKSNPSTGVVG